MAKRNYYFLQRNILQLPFNVSDILALILILCVIALLALTTKQMTVSYHVGEILPISLSPSELPHYALRSTVRMAIAMLFSLLFTFVMGTWAAKSKAAERIIIPSIDVLQSVPVLGFLSITIAGFMALFRGSLLGPECAAIFAVFVSQVWNMTLGFYQTLRTVPHELHEAADMFHLSAWQRFWRLEVPFSMPGLLWNMMMSMSASWFFVVASEAISVANHEIMLPGIGSYIALAISHADVKAVGYAIFAMLCVILLYDQLLFRPLMVWAEKFKAETMASEEEPSSWLVNLLQRTEALRQVGNFIGIGADKFINNRLLNRRYIRINTQDSQRISVFFNRLSKVLLLSVVLLGCLSLWRFIHNSVGVHEIAHVFILGLYTGLRIVALIVFCSLVWLPIGVWIGLRPYVAQRVQPIVQFCAAFPANLFFPLFVLLIVKYQLNQEIWLTPLMILGTQWYVLFNVIAGTSSIPKDLRLAADNLGLKGWLWWKRLILPGVLPYFITGAITAVGGAWNASIIAEVVSWGNTTLKATGLGAYITEYTHSGDFPRIALGIGVMCIYVLVLNRLVWQPLYNLAETRFKLD
ncbi:MAG: transporter permease subunit [Gammaproteobacteria bacterium]|jgi:NitT/TauT family transport system permease protein|nr:transporter permease subunit [Gammaproteobacteria bacterium]